MAEGIGWGACRGWRGGRALVTCCTAPRHAFPGKLAVASGADPADVRGAGGGGVSDAAALAAEGLNKGDRLALLSPNCWQFAVLVVRDRPPWRDLGAGQFHARPRGDRLHPLATVEASSVRRRRWRWPPLPTRRWREPGFDITCPRGDPAVRR